jgi:hypothetical protein
MEAQTPREKEIRALIREHARGRTTWEEIAGRDGIAVSTLSWWRSEIRRRDRLRSEVQHDRFVEVEIDASVAASSSDPFELVLTDGRSVRVPAGFDASDLGRLLEVIDGTC